MAGLKQIKSKIRSVEKTQTVTKAMEAVSAAKMRKAQLNALGARSYARAAVSILARVSGTQMLKNNALMRTAASVTPRALYMVITSDKGLAGGLNNAVLRRVHNDIVESGFTTETASIIAVGKKANDFFTARGFTVETFHPNNDDLTSDITQEVVLEIASRFTLGAVDVVKVAYQNFISTFEQRPTVRTVFPLSLEELALVVDSIPDKTATAVTQKIVAEANSYTVEPSEEAVLAAIIPKLASIFVYHALLETRASEHSARMVAMKSASDKAEEMEHSLTLQFNKARQAAITREVSEITGGMEAMAR